jgi:hypothetical protein
LVALFKLFLIAGGKLCLEFEVGDEFIVAEGLDRNHLWPLHAEEKKVVCHLLSLSRPEQQLGQRDANPCVEGLSHQSRDLNLIQRKIQSKYLAR